MPVPTADRVLIRVHTCGGCCTDLHIVDGELTQPKLPLIPGHQIVGTVVGYGTNVNNIFPLGTRVGVPWLGHTCNCCHYCRSGRENLCDRAQFTGYDLDGGYAEYAVAGNVYADLGDENPEEMLLKAQLVRLLSQAIKAKGLNQYQAAEVLGIDRPKVSALVRGQFRGYSLERLFRFLNAFDLDVEVSVKSKPEDRERSYTTVGS